MWCFCGEFVVKGVAKVVCWRSLFGVEVCATFSDFIFEERAGNG
jgi:hypothetical protein